MNFEQFRNYVWGMYGNNTISRGWELYKKSQHALWMARAERAATEKFYWHHRYDDDGDKGYTKKYRWLMCEKWCWVERKCLQKAKEFE